MRQFDDSELNNLTDELTFDVDDYESRMATKPILVRIRENPIICLILFVLEIASVKNMIEILPNVDLLYLIPIMFLGLFFADFASGLIHMILDHVWLDAIPTRKRPIMQWLGWGFQYHHVEPNNWQRFDVFYLGIIKMGSYVFIPFTLIQLFLVENYYIQFYIFIFAHTLSCTQVVHAAAHGRWKMNTATGRFINVLQKYRIIIRPVDHRAHHMNFDQNFTLINGWSNPFIHSIYPIFLSLLTKPEMYPDIQRKVYFENKAKLEKPYFQMYPDLRPYAE